MLRTFAVTSACCGMVCRVVSHDTERLRCHPWCTDMQVNWPCCWSGPLLLIPTTRCERRHIAGDCAVCHWRAPPLTVYDPTLCFDL